MIKVATKTVPQNLRRHFEVIGRHGIDPAQLFTLQQTPAGERFLRAYASPLVGNMPAPVKTAFTDFMKRVRNPGGTLDLRYPLDFPENQKIVDDIAALQARPWKGKKAAVCLCHDVDDRFGYEQLRSLLKTDVEHQIPATYFFLTHDAYELRHDFLTEIQHSGGEIALHGDTHDQGFAFRQLGAIDERLARAMELLREFNVRGYRSPALSVSPALFGAVKTCGLAYDSSLQVASPFYNSVRLPYPVYLENYGLWEIPLMIQDDNYLRDTRTPYDKILGSIRRFTEEVIRLNGVFVLNLHPHLMARHWDLYRELLALLRSNSELAFSTMGGVVEMAREGSS